MRRRGPVLFLLGFAAIVFVVLLVYSCDAEARAASATHSRVTRIRATICDVFGARCAAAFRVARCETGGTFNRFATGSAGERGLFQIHPVHFGWLDERRLYEVRYNARAAFKLSQGGRNWAHWTCQP